MVASRLCSLAVCQGQLRPPLFLLLLRLCSLLLLLLLPLQLLLLLLPLQLLLLLLLALLALLQLLLLKQAAKREDASRSQASSHRALRVHQRVYRCSSLGQRCAHCARLQVEHGGAKHHWSA